MKVSVIIPVYNAEDYILRCLTSILNQSHHDIEIIVVNDGSTDSSASMVRELADERVKLIEQENGGVSAARNAALQSITGDYVAFVDADDFLQPTYMEDMIIAMEQNGADLVCCGYNRVNQVGEIVGGFPGKQGKDSFLSKEDLLVEMLLHGHLASSLWNKMFKADLMKDMCFEKAIAIGEDMLFLVEYVGRAKSCYFVQNRLYNYFVNPAGALKNIQVEKQFKIKWESEWLATCRMEKLYPFDTRKLKRILEYKKMLVSVKILNKAKRFHQRDAVCLEMQDYVRSNRIHALLNPYLGWKTKAKMFLV